MQFNFKEIRVSWLKVGAMCSACPFGESCHFGDRPRSLGTVGTYVSTISLSKVLPSSNDSLGKEFGGALKRAEAVCLQDGVLVSIINKRKAFFCRLMGIQIRLMRDCHKRSTNDVMCIVGATDGYHERNLH